ncbi:hypothetical protein ScPMuIL_017145 [Solemya velum]
MKVYSYGRNNHGQLGVGSLDPENTYDPLLIEGLSDKEVVDICCGRNHCAVLCENGDVYCWGSSKDGQCGSEEDRVTSPRHVPIQLPEEVCSHGIPFIPEKAFIKQIACGMSHTMVLSDNHEVWVWGSGLALGVVTIETSVQPILLEYLLGKNVLSIFCGDQYSLALVEKSESGIDVPTLEQRPSVQYKTHRYFPPTCVKCNEEIYSYTETCDTCIISDKHKCSNSLSSSGMSAVDSSVVMVRTTDSSDIEVNITNQVSKASKLGEDDTDSEKQNSDSARCESPTFQEACERETDCPANEDKDEKIDVWQKRTDSPVQSGIFNTDRIENKSSTIENDPAGSTGIPRSKSFIDENTAREFLAKQLEATQKSSPNLKKKSSSSNLLQGVTTATNKVIGGIKNSVSDTINYVSGQGVELISFSKNSEIEPKSPVKKRLLTPESSPQREATPSSAESSLCELPVAGSGVLESDEEDGKRPLSMRRILAQQEQFERKMTRESGKENCVLKHIAVETEVWTWGKNNKGQLGTGDMMNRPQPTLIKALSNKCIVKVSCGQQHTLALTANSQVYTWGLNDHGQLGHSELTASPYRIKLMSDKYVWDVEAGDTHSLFLIDGAGFRPDVFYSGLHPCKDLCVQIHKTTRLTSLNFLKKLGWVRCISAGGDNCACIVNKSTSGELATLYEVALWSASSSTV